MPSSFRVTLLVSLVAAFACDDVAPTNGDSQAEVPDASFSSGKDDQDRVADSSVTPTNPGECSSTPEVCNGQDDDCDGLIDEAFAVGESCRRGEGSCARDGVWVCDTSMDAVCDASPGEPSDELCNATDDDCDGLVDEGFERLGQACEWTDGECSSSGEYVCNGDGSGTTCDALPVAPSDERCDGLDNDCDESIDEGYGVGDVCSVGQGACLRDGAIECGEEGESQCNVEAGVPEEEACDGVDNDCDGLPDEDFGGGVCEAGVGACQRNGFIRCVDGGDLSCDAEPGDASRESCNGTDDDCDGVVDEDWPTLGEECSDGVGQCRREGVIACGGGGQEPFMFEGVQQAVDIAAIEGRGFERCWSRTFGDLDEIDTMLEACDEATLLLGCRPVGEEETLSVAAMGVRDEILFDVGDIGNDTNEHNGVAWYFSRGRSWGFAPAGSDVSRVSCDTERGQGAQRMCWHTFNGRVTAGYRCGEELGVTRDYVREIYHRPTGPRAECTALAAAPAEAEACNGFDDDCDGLTDEGIAGVGEPCQLDEPMMGCFRPVTRCAEDGDLICFPEPTECPTPGSGGPGAGCPAAPAPETCNLRDDDCDGVADEDFPGLGDVCAVGVGACRNEGVLRCDDPVEPSLPFEGVRQNLPHRALVDDGFEPCWSGNFTGTAPIEDILAACAGEELVLGCQTADADMLTLAATGFRDEVLRDVGPAVRDAHEHNGVVWYFNGESSWGFAPAGATVNRRSCDTLGDQGELRMCWHTRDGQVTRGYRCGQNRLNVDAGWERVIYQRAPQQPVVCSAEAGVPREVERCNSIDDDCDGRTDEGVAGIGEPCQLEGLTPCEQAVLQCGEDGELECTRVPAPGRPERCNGLDDDCDGLADEDFPRLGERCSVGVGACAAEGVGICSPGGEGELAFSGIQQNVPELDLFRLGFDVCWSGLYGLSSPLDDALEGCRDDQLVMACRRVGDPRFSLAATGFQAEVTRDVGDERDASHEHNGVTWYFSPSRSWGFAPAGAVVNRNTCDFRGDDPELRMCWHTRNGLIWSGYRCGAEDLNGRFDWERVILQRPSGESVVCSAEPAEPGEREVCGPQDDDCDGAIDEGLMCLD